MTNTKLKTILIGALIIAGVALPVWQQKRLEESRSQLAQFQVQGAELTALREEADRLRKVEIDQTELEQLRQFRSQTQPELLRLRAMAGVARRANAEAAELRAQFQRKGSEGAVNEAVSPMAELMKNTMDQTVSSRLSRLTDNLHLAPEQVSAVRDILTRQARAVAAGVQQVFSGKSSKEELAQAAADGANSEEQIKALLTPEQQAGYQSYHQEKSTQNARLVANGELLQMQNTLGLSSEQQDQAFGVLYQAAFNQMNGAATQTFANSVDQLQWANDQKTKALESVLTASQLQSYRQQQDIQLKFLKDMLSKGENANAGK